MKTVNKAASELGKLSWEKNKKLKTIDFFKRISKLGVEKRRELRQQKIGENQASASEDQV